MLKRHRVAACNKGDGAETGTGNALPWRSAGDISEIVGTLTDRGGPGHSTDQAAEILKVLGAREDPTACGRRLRLHEADRPEGSG